MFTSSTVTQLWVQARGAADRVRWFSPLLARVTLGVLFVSTGWGKIHNLDKVTDYFIELHIPAPHFQAVMVSWVELIGGSLLVMGLASRIAALPLAVSMVVATSTAKGPEIHSLPDLFGEIEFAYLVMLIWIALGGPGAISVDHVVAARMQADHFTGGQSSAARD